MKASDIERLVFSPFHTSRILHHFLCGVKSVNQKSIKTELIYLVFPFIYCELTQNKLKTLNKNSKLNKFINNPEFDVFLSVLNEKIKKFRKVTNTAIVVLSNKIELDIDSFINTNDCINYNTEKDKYLRQIYKSSYNFGVLLGKEQYLSVFKKLRIIEL